MRNLWALLLTINLLIFSGCTERSESGSAPGQVAQKPAAPAADADARPEDQMASLYAASNASTQDISFDSAASAQAATSAADRKIIRNAELTLETDTPTDGQQRITEIAGRLSGFVVTSEFKQNTAPGAKANQSVVVIVRVPSPQFSAALDQILGLGNKVVQRKVTGQDVSEEYLDIEARIRTKKALEAQFLEIMKQAKKVADALEVQKELADVRTEIERFEGRRRFLENQSALSTITINLQSLAPVVATTGTGFGHDIKQAFGDAIDIAAALILFLIRAVIVLTPIALIFGLPVWLVWRLVRRRFRSGDEPVPSLESQ